VLKSISQELVQRKRYQDRRCDEQEKCVDKFSKKNGTLHKGFRQALSRGELLTGSWIQINHPTSAEILSQSGFDWIGVDLEHSDIDIVSFAEILRGSHPQTAVLARVSQNDNLEIRRALDVGANGVLVPLVSSAEEAEKAVASAKYPPLGMRGYCYSRMNNWGSLFQEYSEHANDSIVVIVMIETEKGVENIDEITRVEGVDGVFIGPYDLSGSYGIPGKISDPIVDSACEKVVESCKKSRKPVGLHVVLPTQEAIEKAVRTGYSFIAVGADVVFLCEASKAALRIAENAYQRHEV
jgi:2-keto-3-deoxy-L-rhamnonate aldolase RhmA